MRQPYRTAAEREGGHGGPWPVADFGLLPLLLWCASVARCVVAWRQGDFADPEPLLAIALAVGLARTAVRVAWRAASPGKR
jgi:hypothetical protein